jgi:hypothetical protein
VATPKWLRSRRREISTLKGSAERRVTTVARALQAAAGLAARKRPQLLRRIA